MTTNDRFERTVSDWLREDAGFRVPDHLDEVLQATAGTRQRPAWSSLERWLPVDTTFRPRLFSMPSAGRLLMAAALILLVLAFAIIAVGSQRSRLPEPFGLARNGSGIATVDGDIVAFDPVTQERSPLIDDANFDFAGTFSRDGTQFMFLRSREEPANLVNPMLILAVADVDGGNVRELTPPMRGLDWSDWSPDGQKIAFLSREADGVGLINVVDLVSGAITTSDVGVSAHFVTWRPPDGSEILFRGESDQPGIYALRIADGVSRRITERPANNMYDYQSMTVSPDGRTVSFTQWSTDDAALPRVHMLDLNSGEERVLPTPPGTGQRGGATFSPDGVTVAYARIDRDPAGAMAEVVVAHADGSDEGRVVGPRIATTPEAGDIPLYLVFSPDGTAVIARYGGDVGATVHWLPVDGSPGHIIDDGAFGFADIQRLAP